PGLNSCLMKTNIIWRGDNPGERSVFRCPRTGVLPTARPAEGQPGDTAGPAGGRQDTPPERREVSQKDTPPEQPEVSQKDTPPEQSEVSLKDCLAGSPAGHRASRRAG